MPIGLVADKLSRNSCVAALGCVLAAALGIFVSPGAFGICFGTGLDKGRTRRAAPFLGGSCTDAEETV